VAHRELQQLVTWTVEDPPAEASMAVALQALFSTAAAVATFGVTTGAASRPTWTLPADPDAYVDIGLVQVRGDASWLPAGPRRRHRLQATQRAVLVAGLDGRRAPTAVPLADLRISGARFRGVGRRPRHANAPWTLTLSGAGAADVDGAWLALAWIGQLAGWPEPA